MTNHFIQSRQLETRRVGLFVTCLVNVMRPSVGFAALQLLEDAGCEVTVPEPQTCCSQPAYNSGDDEGARQIAKQVIQGFEDFDYVVVPSGSCAGMIIKGYEELFINDSEWRRRAVNMATKTYELLQFLVDVCHYQPEAIEFKGEYTYHDSCTGYRSLGIYDQPRKLLESVQHFEPKPLVDNTECCGFGGTFCVKYSALSDAIVTEKMDNIVATEAEYLLGGDVGCLLNMEGKLHREGVDSVIALHTAEVLAGMAPQLIEDAHRGS